MFKTMLAVIPILAIYPTSAAFGQWYGEFDAMAITRTSESLPVFQRNQVTQTVMMMFETRVGSEARLSADNVDLDFVTGGQATLGYQGDMFGLEGSYLITDKWTETASVFDGTGMLASPFTSVGALVNPAVDNNVSAIVDYATEMQSAEIGLTQRIYNATNGTASLLYGVRYASIEEILSYTSDQDTMQPPNNRLHIGVDNRYIGPQLGVLCQGFIPGGTLDCTFKFAGLHHNVDKTTNFNTMIGTGGNSGATLMSEAGINATFFVAQAVQLQLGYHAFSFTDVALATDNFETSLAVLSSGMANVHKNRGVIYQAINLGVTFTH